MTMWTTTRRTVASLVVAGAMAGSLVAGSGVSYAYPGLVQPSSGSGCVASTSINAALETSSANLGALEVSTATNGALELSTANSSALEMNTASHAAMEVNSASQIMLETNGCP